MSDNYRLKLAPAEYDAATGTLTIVASAEEPDRDDEVVVPATLRLDRYRANPVVLWSHDQKGHPIARCETPDGQFACRLDDRGRLVQQWTFGTTPEARQAADLYRDRILRGASIGFISDGTEDVPADEAERLYGVRKRLKRHVGGELVETSAVPVPACPGALAVEWLDVPRAAAVVRRGGADLVTKSFAPYVTGNPAGQTTPTRTPGVAAVSQNATDVTAKDMGDPDGAAAAPAVADGPDHKAEAGMHMEAAMATIVRAFCAGKMEWGEASKTLAKLAKTHGHVTGSDDDAAGDADADADTDTEPTEPDDDGDTGKAFDVLTSEVVALKTLVGDLTTKLAAVEAELADRPTADEVTEVLAGMA